MLDYIVGGVIKNKVGHMRGKISTIRRYVDDFSLVRENERNVIRNGKTKEAEGGQFNSYH